MPIRLHPLLRLVSGTTLYAYIAINNRERRTASVNAGFPVSSLGQIPPKLLDHLRPCIHDKHYSLGTKEPNVYWIRYFIRFHSLRHPMKMGAAKVKAFLSYLTNHCHRGRR